MQALKSVRAKRRLLVVFLALAILIPAVPVAATPAYSISVIYTEFNSLAWTEHTFPGGANYTLPWQVKITNKLTYNETGAAQSAKLQFCNASNKDDLFDLMFHNCSTTTKKGTVDVYQSYTGTGVKIGSFPYTYEEPATYYFSTDGVIVKNKTDTQFEFNFNAWTLLNVSAQGSTEFVATAGIMQLDLSSGAAYGLDIVYAMIPLMIMITVIGMIVKMVDKMGRNIR